jgi:hypothetical protein
MHFRSGGLAVGRKWWVEKKSGEVVEPAQSSIPSQGFSANSSPLNSKEHAASQRLKHKNHCTYLKGGEGSGV